MKKELIAILVLAVLVLGAALSIRRMDTLAGNILSALEASQSYALAGDNKGAEAELERALDMWLGAESYTHIFIRHPEIDSTSDAFYELQQALSESSEGLFACYDKLRYHIISIDTMEKIRIGSVL